MAAASPFCLFPGPTSSNFQAQCARPIESPLLGYLLDCASTRLSLVVTSHRCDATQLTY